MKYLYYSLLLLFAGTLITNANPIIVETPQLIINEFYFDGTGNWTIELYLTKPVFENAVFDSIFVKCNSNEAKLKTVPISTSPNIIVINNDDLENNININKNQDNIVITWFCSGYDQDHNLIENMEESYSLKFGYDIPLYEGQSISVLNYGSIIYKDNSPTIGYANDTIGATGILQGTIYDKHGNIIKNSQFQFDLDYPVFVSDDDGTYSSVVFSNKYMLNRLNNYDTTEVYNRTAYYDIDTFSISIEPGDIISHDIYLKDFEFQTNLTELENNQNIDIITTYNHKDNVIKFYINISKNINITNSKLFIYTTKGILVKEIKLDEKNKIEEEIRLNNITNGCYYYNLTVNNEYIESGKFIKN